LEAEEEEQTGRNENESHPMSPDILRTGEKPSRCLIGEGRREEAGQQSEPSQRSGGVGVDGTSGSSAKESWEISGSGCKARPTEQAGRTSEAGGVAGEVGVPRSSGELLATEQGAKGGHLPNAKRRSEGNGDGRGNPDSNPAHSPGASNHAISESPRRATRRMGSESRIWENRPFGSMRGGRESVIGLVPFNPTSPAYSTSSHSYPVHPFQINQSR